MSLYFIRHGQTILNNQHKFNGESDEELNENGLAEAQKAGEFFKDKKVDLIYCSPLTRTRQTLAQLNLSQDIPVVYDSRLVERKVGKLLGVEINDNNLQNIYLNRYSKAKIEGLETIDDVFERVHSVIDEIKEKYGDKNVLIVAHGFIGRAVYFYFNKLEGGLLGKYPESFPQNCEIREYQFEN